MDAPNCIDLSTQEMVASSEFMLEIPYEASTSSVCRCSKCKVNRPIEEFGNMLSKQFKTCQHCRSFKSKEKRADAESEGSFDMANFDLDGQPISVDEFLDDYAEQCAELEQQQQSQENDFGGLNCTWILTVFPNSEDVKEVAEKVRNWIQDIDEYQWMYV
jgi:hypothetical protein